MDDARRMCSGNKENSTRPDHQHHSSKSTFVAQAVGTLDQMAPRRTFCGLSIGDPNILRNYGHLPNLKEYKPFARLRESMDVIRALMHEGKCNYNGHP